MLEKEIEHIQRPVQPSAAALQPENDKCVSRRRRRTTVRQDIEDSEIRERERKRETERESWRSYVYERQAYDALPLAAAFVRNDFGAGLEGGTRSGTGR